MAAGLTDRLWEMKDVVDVLEAGEVANRGGLSGYHFYWGMNVLPDGPTPVICRITSPSFAHV
jgi:hypothetical protein